MTDVALPADRWVSLYSETGIAVGVPVSVDNIGSADIYLSAVAAPPSPNFKDYVVCQRGNPERNIVGALGAWAYSPGQDGRVNIRQLGDPSEFIRDSGSTLFEPLRTGTARVEKLSINQAVATKIADANPLRQFFRVDLDPGVSSEEVYIRLYPTSTDNIKQGIVISRISSGVIGVRNFFELNASVSGYAGEVSAITNSGDADIFVTEF